MSDQTPEPHTSWQRADGWPTDAYFATVAAECDRRGIRFERRFRDEDWEADFELAPDCFKDSQIAQVWPELVIRWWVSEDSEPAGTGFISRSNTVNTGWFWVGIDSDRTQATWFERLDFLAEPDQVADEIANLIGIGNPSDYQEARQVAAWFAAERDYWRDEARTARAAAINLHADKNVLKGQLRAARRLATETGTRPATAVGRCQATTTGALINEPNRCIWCELPSGHAGNHDAGIPQPGQPDARVSWPEPAPQSDPAGYVVVTRNAEGGLHRSATAWDDLERATAAGDFQARHADGTGCTAAVYELREVQQ